MRLIKKTLSLSALILSLSLLIIIFLSFNKENVNKVSDLEERIMGGIVSHHLLVENEIDNFFKVFANQNIETIVVVGPNHFGFGSGGILTTKNSFQTSLGELNVNTEIVSDLVETTEIEIDNSPFEIDHSMLSLTPFIKKYLGQAEIVPIVLKMGDYNEDSLIDISNRLDYLLGENSVVVASVDFSHHLNSLMADFHDEMSLSVIGNFDFPRIKKLEVDSPASLFLVLNFLKKRSSQKMSYFATNSAKFSRDINSQDVTSYLFAHFFKGEPLFEKKISVLSFGDAMFDREIRRARTEGLDLFSGIRGVEGNFLKGYDLATLNLEGPITDMKKSECQSRENVFRFPQEVGDLLFENNISAVNLANNHAIDCYSAGVENTKSVLGESGVSFFSNSFDSDDTFSTISSGRKISFMGFDNSLQVDKFDESIYQRVEREKQKTNFLVVNVHWGIEYDKGYSKKQQEIAHKFIDSGASLVIGHHPHVIQNAEKYKDKMIFYSLGNFIFDQNRPDTMRGLAIGSVFGEIGEGFYLFPFENRELVPTLMNGEEAEVICEEVFSGIEGNDGCFLYNKKTRNIEF